jgi:hypothetical protein
MTKKTVIAKFVIFPSWCSREKYIHKLIKIGDVYKVELISESELEKTTQLITVPNDEVETQLTLLKSATIPAFPVSQEVCDGGQVKLTIYGEMSELTISWWAAAPEGAEILEEFADWLENITNPEEIEND